MVNRNNYEEYMMMQADGELTAAEEQALMKFLYDNPELHSEFTAYSMTRLTPDENINYANKKALLKPEPKTAIIVLSSFKRYGIAAGVAAILFLSIYGLMNSNTPVTQNITIANNVNVILDKQETPTAVTVDTQKAFEESQLPVASSKPMEIAATTPKQTTKRKIAGTVKQNRKAVVAVTPRHVAIEKTPIGAIPTNELVAINDRPLATSIEPTNVPQMATANLTEDTRKSFIDRLPINEQKKGGLSLVASAINERIEKANDIKQEITASSISFRIEKRKLLISF